MALLERRIAELEKRRARADVPGWLAFATSDELEAYSGPMPGKVYLGISPDDWDTEDEPCER